MPFAAEFPKLETIWVMLDATNRTMHNRKLAPDIFDELTIKEERENGYRWYTRLRPILGDSVALLEDIENMFNFYNSNHTEERNNIMLKSMSMHSSVEGIRQDQATK